ncbi:MAG: THUMP domain-containing protein [Lentimicrobiaceae bacterium]|nr:THUMP domain-containing protein [Lentimicrobiaceae bacterium]
MLKTHTLNQTNTFQLVAKTISGLENSVAKELEKLGATKIEILHRAVSFEGDQAIMYKANYCLRTALRILKPIGNFGARDESSLYKQIQKFDWSKFFSIDQTFAIDAVVSGDIFTHSQYAALKVKDAIVDQFRDRFGSRPSVNTYMPDFRMNVHITNERVTLAADSSGESLHKRGYRKMVDKAPINEVLAAGLIQLTGWNRDSNFVDCMCGSGTIPIEAAMYAMKIPAGYYRSQFGFMRWSDFDAQLWQTVKQVADTEICEFDHEIIASDRSGKAIDIARGNIQNAHLQHDIKVIKKNMEELIPPEGGGIMLINPPYGERLEESDIISLYQTIGNTLKKNFKGFQAWAVSSDLQALKYIGLKPSRKIPIYNGPLECRLVCFDIFDGSYKDKKARENKNL